jgi:hypothetical protein
VIANRTTVVLLGVCLGLCRAAASASPASGCRPAAGHLRVGAQVRGLELDAYEYDNREIVDNNGLDQENLLLEYGVTDYLFVAFRFGTIGWDPAADGGRRFGEGTGWGIGIGGAVPLYAPTHSDVSIAAAWDFHYDQAVPDDMHRTAGDVFEGEVEWWQTSGAAHCTWRNLCGFAGARYTQVDLTYTHDSRAGTRRGGFEEDEPLGFFVGGGATFFDAFVLRGEYQFAGVEAYALTFAVNLPLGGYR